MSLRTFNRNFKGRSGTGDAQVYLVSPETAACAAITGFITDPLDFAHALADGAAPKNVTRCVSERDDGMLIAPLSAAEADLVEIVRGPNIKACPVSPTSPTR